MTIMPLVVLVQPSPNPPPSALPPTYPSPNRPPAHRFPATPRLEPASIAGDPNSPPNETPKFLPELAVTTEDMEGYPAGSDDKIAYFQAVTGLGDRDLCTEILAAHAWDLDVAVTAFTADPAASANSGAADRAGVGGGGSAEDAPTPAAAAAGPGLVWRVVTLPISVVSGAVGLGFWVAGGILSHSLGLLGWRSGGSDGNPSGSSSPLVRVSPAAREAAEFAELFEREFGAAAAARPGFVAEGFMDALQRSRRELKLLFVYLHSPEHPDTPRFCRDTLCSEAVAAFLNENFVCWGGNIRASEGFKMSNSLKASRFPFCALVMATPNNRISLLYQVEGPKTPDEMLIIFQKVLEDSAPSLIAERLEAEERRNNMRLREEQDAAYQAALEADQARERQIIEEQERLEREAAEAERKRKEEEEAQERAVCEAAEKEAALARRRQEKAVSLGVEPEKGPNVTQVLVRFPTGERKERRFHSASTIQSIYDFVDSLDCLQAENYSLVSNFPRVTYGPDKVNLSLKEAGLHPQASLFIEVDS